MAVWTCPECRRDFGAVGRSHICQPGMSVDAFLTGVPAFVPPVFDAVHDHLVAVDERRERGALIVDPIDGKVLFKNGPTFCILEVKTKWVAVGFSLRRQLESGRLSRKVLDYGTKFFHVVNVSDPEQVDDEFREWLTEAYGHGAEPAEPAAASGDPMVPDDVDIVIAPPPV